MCWGGVFLKINSLVICVIKFWLFSIIDLGRDVASAHKIQPMFLPKRFKKKLRFLRAVRFFNAKM
jgi:hypothetical protein